MVVARARAKPRPCCERDRLAELRRHDRGDFAYATEADNYFSVPEAVHASGMIRLTIHYRDMSSKVVELSALQLGTAGAEIVLP